LRKEGPRLQVAPRCVFCEGTSWRPCRYHAEVKAACIQQEFGDSLHAFPPVSEDL
jgi:hypothetical protein